MSHYFAYGSNLHPARLGVRIPSARFVCVATLPGYCLYFHKRGRDGSAKCNAGYTAGATDRVIGAVYQMNVCEKARLDACEAGYRTEEIVLISQRGGPISAFTYSAELSHIDDALHPYTWYKRLVIEGAKYHGLPLEYVRRIDQVCALPDPHVQRDQAARAVLGLPPE